MAKKLCIAIDYVYTDKKLQKPSLKSIGCTIKDNVKYLVACPLFAITAVNRLQ